MPRIIDNLVQNLWKHHLSLNPELQSIPNLNKLTLDHIAIIDISGENAGITYLSTILKELGMEFGGSGYLADKINDFHWMYDPQSMNNHPNMTLPQFIIADFRLDQLSKKNRDIIHKYRSAYSYTLSDAINCINSDNPAQHLFNLLNSPQSILPSYKEYMSVKEENELIAWILIFGRKANHFGIGVYTDNNISSFAEFNSQLSQNKALSNKYRHNSVQGHKDIGIEQSSIYGTKVDLKLEGGEIEIRDSFTEFVWRYKSSQQSNTISQLKHDKEQGEKCSQIYMSDERRCKVNDGIWYNEDIFSNYYTGFIPANADKIVESTYEAAL